MEYKEMGYNKNGSTYGNGVNGAGRHKLCNVRLTHLVIILLLVLISVPLISHYYLSSLGAAENGAGGFDSHRSRSKLEHTPDDLTGIKFSDLKFRIEELKRIKASINNELRELEEKRQTLQVEIAGYTEHLSTIRADYEHSHVELQQLKASIDSSKLEREELVQRTLPELKAPMRILPSELDGESLQPPNHLRH